MRNLARAMALGVLCLALVACSWIGVRTENEPACTTARGAPVADVVAATAFVVGGTIFGVAVLNEAHGDSGEIAGIIGLSSIGGGLLLGTVELFSAEYGFRHTARCRARRSGADAY